MITEDHLNKIIALAKQATPIPWKRGTGNDYREICKEGGPKIAEVYGGYDGWFIEMACNSIVEIATELLKARTRIKELEKL